MVADRLRVAVATPLPAELAALIVRLEPRVDLALEPDLLPPQRFPGDHAGDPEYRRTPDQESAFAALLDSAQALYGIPDERPADLARTVRANPSLRWVHTMAAGGGASVEAADLSAQELARVVFTTSAGVHAEPLAEFCVFGVLAGRKSLPRLRAQQASKTWTGRWEMGLVQHSRVLLIGTGGIGRVVAGKMKALGATVIGMSRRADRLPDVDEIVRPEDLVRAVADVDAIVISLPGTDLTRGLVGRDLFAAVKPGVTVVNVGRGTVVDEPALVDALRDGRVGFAALDVFAVEPLPADSPLWSMDNVLISPHTAALNSAEDRLIAELFARNATRFLDGVDMINQVDTVEFY